MSDIDQYLEGLVTKVCTDLARIYAPDQQASEFGLVFPTKRDGSIRISEQEAKLLFVQHLTIDRQFCFSVETPTIETYKQKGTTPMSARVDLTLFGPDRKPLAHIELKAHNCAVESIRKDLEKLLREKTTGVWFHTLERADRGTLGALATKFKSAFSRLAECTAVSDRSYLIAFFVLDSTVLRWRWLRLSGHEDQNNSALNAFFDFQGEAAVWQTNRFREEGVDEGGKAAFRIRKSSSRGKGAREGFLVFAPKVDPNSFLHLSARGGSYRFRKYDLDEPGNRPQPFTIPEYPTFDSLRESSLIARWVSVTADDMAHNIDGEPAYWSERIRVTNLTHQIPASSIGGA